MRRTITTLMFLAVGGLVAITHAADNGGNANWQYYAAANGTYRISDDDDTAAAGQSSVANAGGTTQQAGQEHHRIDVVGLSDRACRSSGACRLVRKIRVQ